MAKIFVVDDDPSIAGLLRDLLESMGHELTTYQSSKEALRVLRGRRELRPNLILLDVMMPDIDGFTFVTKLSENKWTQKIPVIILTARGQLEDLFQQYPSVKAFVAKPFDLRSLSSIVHDALNAA